ncbi:MAG TPA: hypothetical protein VK854_05640, partial [Woeseiaceae bacterium]|nr:hypothetical protein [Woeseiaceae bacterium]
MDSDVASKRRIIPCRAQYRLISYPLVIFNDRESIMSGVRWLAAWAVLCVSMAAQAATISLSHHEPLQRLSVAAAT